MSFVDSEERSDVTRIRNMLHLEEGACLTYCRYFGRHDALVNYAGGGSLPPHGLPTGNSIFALMMKRMGGYSLQ